MLAVHVKYTNMLAVHVYTIRECNHSGTLSYSSVTFAQPFVRFGYICTTFCKIRLQFDTIKE